MSLISSYTSKLRSRLKQPDVEEETTSLSAKAFRQRILDDEETQVPSAVSVPRHRVAVYQPKPNRMPRTLLRLLLVVVAPLLALLLIAAVVLNVVSENRNTTAVEAESSWGNIPLPAGVRAIARAKNLNLQASGEFYLEKAVPAYRRDFKGAATYISPKPIEELTQFYNSRLVEPKPPPWQIYGKPGYIASFYTVLYVRALNNQNNLEALILQLEPVNKDLLSRDPSYYDRQAKPGETVIILTRFWLALK